MVFNFLVCICFFLALSHGFTTRFQVAHSNNFDECMKKMWNEWKRENEIKKKSSEMEFDFKPRITLGNREVHTHTPTYTVYMWCVMRNTYALYTMEKAILMREERSTTIWLGIHAYIYLDSMIEYVHIVYALFVNRSALVLFSCVCKFFPAVAFFSFRMELFALFMCRAHHCCVASGVQNSYH